MVIIGSLYAADNVNRNSAARWGVVILSFAFAMIHVSNWAIVGSVYASEVQPAEARAIANSVRQSLNFVITDTRYALSYSCETHDLQDTPKRGQHSKGFESVLIVGTKVEALVIEML